MPRMISIRFRCRTRESMSENRLNGALSDFFRKYTQRIRVPTCSVPVSSKNGYSFDSPSDSHSLLAAPIGYGIHPARNLQIHIERLPRQPRLSPWRPFCWAMPLPYQSSTSRTIYELFFAFLFSLQYTLTVGDKLLKPWEFVLRYGFPVFGNHILLFATICFAGNCPDPSLFHHIADSPI